MMLLRSPLRCLALVLSTLSPLAGAPDATKAGQSPADHLPPYIEHLTTFGERADFSPDGTRILFLSKTFGDAMELNLATRRVRNLTQHYPHYGYTRALYLSNGDILLAGPLSYDLTNPGAARRNCYLFVLSATHLAPPTPLGIRCNEGPAVSRSRLHLAWTEWYDPPAGSHTATSKMFRADVVYTDGVPALAHRELILDGADLPFRCTMETQNFRPPAERELIFSAYTDGGRLCEVMGVDLASKQVVNYTQSPEIYDEPEGIFPDGTATLIESDQTYPHGSSYVDLWRLELDGSGRQTRLTFFTDYPGYKSSNPVISDDGHYMAFQMAHPGEEAGIGHGIFLYDLRRAP